MAYNKNDSTPTEQIALEAFVDDPASSVHIERSQHIVEEQYLGLRVHSARERDTRLLATTQCQTLLAHLGLVASLEKA